MKKVLIFDIETASRYKNPKKENPEHFEVFKYKRRDRETGALPTDTEALSLYKNEAALSPIYGQIVCISCGIFAPDGSLRIKTFQGEESEILKQFVKLVKEYNYKLVGYNVPFDLPYIRKRFLHHGLTDYLSANQGLDVGVKPWELTETTLDLLQVLKGVGWANESLEEACLLLNIPTPKKGDCTGPKVSEYFHSGKINEIVEYCEEDVKATAQIYLKLQPFINK